MPRFRKINGQWHEVDKRFRKIDGQWRKVKTSFRKSNGEWLQVHADAIHTVYTSGLENFIGTYTVERRDDGTFYCALEGKVNPGTNAQIGFMIPVPDNSRVAYIFDYEKWVYEQENEVRVEDNSRIIEYYRVGHTNWQSEYIASGFFKIYFNVDISAVIRTNFTVKNLTINGVLV